jgi:hypothetical protein
MAVDERSICFDFSSRSGSVVWRLGRSPGGRAVVGAASSLSEASREASDALKEIEPAAAPAASTMIKSIVAWSGLLECFGRNVAGVPK